jgi:hypothetical protein
MFWIAVLSLLMGTFAPADSFTRQPVKGKEDRVVVRDDPRTTLPVLEPGCSTPSCRCGAKGCIYY